MLDQYCVSCHNERLKTGDLTLDKIDLENVPGNAAVWEKVILKLRMGMMPPLRRPAARSGHTTETLTTTMPPARCPLMRATVGSDLPIVQLLLAHKADVNLSKPDGTTALMAGLGGGGAGRGGPPAAPPQAPAQ